MENQNTQKLESSRQQNQEGSLIAETTVWIKRDERSHSQPGIYDLQMNSMQVLSKTGEMISPHIVPTDSTQTMKAQASAHITNQTITENNFFLTGVNVEAQPQQITQQQSDPDLADIQRVQSAFVDRYKLIAVVDSVRTFSTSDCVFVNSRKHLINHVNVAQKTTFKFDELVSTYEQVFKVGQSLAYSFVNLSNSNKVVLNLADQHSANNNFGFNLANFKSRFIKNYYDEVVQDYERSFIGSFSQALIENYLPQVDCELYFSISKFVNNMGFSLTQNKNQDDLEVVNIDYADASLLSPSYEEVIVHQKRQKKSTFLTNQERNQKRKKIMKKGAIPEFVPVSEMATVYKLLTEANVKNKILEKNLAGLNDDEVMANNEDQAKSQQTEEEALDLQNIKEDLIVMQFKIVRKDTLKTQNTITFINLPASKMNDVNIVTLTEILSKQKNPQANEKKFLPYNKSIMTRIVYDQLKEHNILTVSHFSRVAIQKYFRVPEETSRQGPARGLYNMLLKFGYQDSMTKSKLSPQTALKILERFFKHDLHLIYSEIRKFREGLKSFEIYTESLNNKKFGGRNLTMFHQMLYFLTLKDEMNTDAIDHNQKQVGVVNKNKFPSVLSDDEIQRVIFDENYVKYIKNKDSQLAFGGDYSRMSLNQQSSAGPTSGAATSTIGQFNNKNLKLQFVQYECIKSELKEEYERKINVLNKKFDQKALDDPSYMLLGNFTYEKKNNRPQQHLRDTELQKIDAAAQGQKILNRRAVTSNRNKSYFNGEARSGERELSRDKSQYYHFYLNNAQKAIDLMISKHQQVNKRPLSVDKSGIKENQSQTKINQVSSRLYMGRQNQSNDDYVKKIQRAISGTKPRTSVPLPLEAETKNEEVKQPPIVKTKPKSAKAFTRGYAVAQRLKTGYSLRQTEFQPIERAVSPKIASESNQIKEEDQKNLLGSNFHQNFAKQLVTAKQKDFLGYKSLRSQGALRCTYSSGMSQQKVEPVIKSSSPKSTLDKSPTTLQVKHKEFKPLREQRQVLQLNPISRDSKSFIKNPHIPKPNHAEQETIKHNDYTSISNDVEKTVQVDTSKEYTLIPSENNTDRV